MIILKIRNYILLDDVLVNGQTKDYMVKIWRATNWPRVHPLLTDAIRDTVKPWEQATWWETHMDRG